MIISPLSAHRPGDHTTQVLVRVLSRISQHVREAYEVRYQMREHERKVFAQWALQIRPVFPWP